MCIWRVLCARRNMSTESQAERMETAATEFQRRYHISVDQPAAGPGQVRSGAGPGPGGQMCFNDNYKCRGNVVIATSIGNVKKHVSSPLLSALVYLGGEEVGGNGLHYTHCY